MKTETQDLVASLQEQAIGSPSYGELMQRAAERIQKLERAEEYAVACYHSEKEDRRAVERDRDALLAALKELVSGHSMMGESKGRAAIALAEGMAA